MLQILENNFKEIPKKENEIIKENIKNYKYYSEINLSNLLYKFYNLGYKIEIKETKQHKIIIKLKEKNFKTNKKMLLLIFYDLKEKTYKNIKENINYFNKYLKF